MRPRRPGDEDTRPEETDPAMMEKTKDNQRIKGKKDAPSGKERRRFPRYNAPVVVEIPVLSDMPLMPEDIGAGGMQVIVTARPKKGLEVECTLCLTPDVVHKYPARVVWVRENAMDLSTWVVGLHMQVPEDRREDLDASLRSFSGSHA